MRTTRSTYKKDKYYKKVTTAASRLAEVLTPQSRHLGNAQLLVRHQLLRHCPETTLRFSPDKVMSQYAKVSTTR